MSWSSQATCGFAQVEVGLRLDKAGGKDVAKMSKDRRDAPRIRERN